jgi:signal peptidase II
MIVMLLIDQYVKHWTRTHISSGGSFHGLPIPGIFEFTLTYNEGVAFGKLQGYGLLMAPVALIIAGAAGYYSWKRPSDSRWNHVTAALLAAGALGNLIDRIIDGKVTDMFEIRLFNFPVFNVADVCISVAACMMIVTWLREGWVAKNAPRETVPTTGE